MVERTPSAEGLLPSAYSNAKTILESRQSKIDQQLSMTKSVLEDYNLSLKICPQD